MALKTGGQITMKDRESETKRFKYGQIDSTIAANVTGNAHILERSLEDICTDAVIDAGGCLLEDITDASDRYSAKQTINAYFVDSETKIAKFLKLNLGARFEESKQSILTYQGVNRRELESNLIMKDLLPVVGTTIFLSDTIQLRAAYSETISRPDFKDLNPGTYYDDEKGRAISGNLNLKGTVIKNMDARLEWYFAAMKMSHWATLKKISSIPSKKSPEPLTVKVNWSLLSQNTNLPMLATPGHQALK